MNQEKKQKKQQKQQKQRSPQGQRTLTSLILALIAVIFLSAATVAWFSIADYTKVNSISMEVTTGVNLRFDLDAHQTFDEYVKTLSFEQIASRIRTEKGFDMSAVPLEPVTTNNYTDFTLENGTLVKDSSGAYLEFTLHFMAVHDMVVHLTSENTAGASDGTKVSSGAAALPSAMRISFTTGTKTCVYDPGMGAASVSQGNTKLFGLGTSGAMVLSDDNALFSLKKDVDQPVVVHIWMEGTDEACTDELRGSDYSIQLRFVGTDEDNNLLTGEEK